MKNLGQQTVSKLQEVSERDLIKEFEKLEKDQPSLAAAFKLISLNVCADVMAHRGDRGNVLIDMGADLSHLVLHAAQKVIPNKAIAKSIAEDFNASVEMREIKDFLRTKQYSSPALIDVDKV